MKDVYRMNAYLAIMLLLASWGSWVFLQKLCLYYDLLFRYFTWFQTPVLILGVLRKLVKNRLKENEYMAEKRYRVLAGENNY